MTYFQALILGIIQGLAEFLPISSSGHLALLQNFFGINADNILSFTVMLHVGTLISVFIIYWNDIFALIKELFSCLKDIFTGKGPRINANETRRLGFLIITATIPTAIIGFLFEDYFNSLYSNIIAIGIGLVFTGTILFAAEHFGKGTQTAENMKFRTAIFVGIMQGIAICPGVSRSGSTLVGGLSGKLRKDFAVKFAFLISIPTILGSAILEIPDMLKAGLDASLAGPILLGLVTSAVCGYLAIKLMIRLVQNQKLIIFSIYTWALGLGIVIYSLLA